MFVAAVKWMSLLLDFMSVGFFKLKGGDTKVGVLVQDVVGDLWIRSPNENGSRDVAVIA